jgi:glycosyltransferase involved in cell wall biosynthesis
MLSICIPVYNFSVITLVLELNNQCQKIAIDYEILVLEDGSTQINFSENEKHLSMLANVKHLFFEKNQGRSRARNHLANTAQFDNLLFLDCDSEINNENFIKNYIENIDNSVICGGLVYLESQKIKNSELRYMYGIKVEMRPAELRNKNNKFTSNNFLIQRKIFEKIRFQEFLTKYGHEDSIFGYELRKNKINIKHINNPVIHTGIDENSVFLEKTRIAIDNLNIIKKQTSIDPDFLAEITLVKTYKKIKNIYLHYLLKKIFTISCKLTEKYLLNSQNPKILIFNFYKLGYYSSIQ